MFFDKFNKKDDSVSIKEIRMYFPKEKLKKLYALSDKYYADYTDSAKYELWNYIYDTLELKRELEYSLNTDEILNPYVVLK